MSWHPECYEAAVGRTGKVYISKFRTKCQSVDCQHGSYIEIGSNFTYSTYGGVEQTKSHSQLPELKTTMVAKRINAIVILNAQAVGDELVLETSCADFDTLKTLPQVVSYEGIVCGMTGWNSDRGHAYYKSKVKIALPIGG
jgi:hypothetical protein